MIHDPRSKIQEGGFTLIETLVVALVTVMLAAIMIVYSHTGEKQIALFRDQAKVVGILNRTKFLSVQMFSKTPITQTSIDVPCAYGVHFNNDGKDFLIFKDLKTDPNQSCTSGNHNNKYDSGELFEQYSLDQRLKFQTNLSDVVFIPPDPEVILTGTSDNPAKIFLIDISDTSGKNKKEVDVNTFGQITTQ
ncbi:MAG: type II secretion system protein [Candidatus Paceibacterota bacterium]|jgi:Tfp pilus assembly major pilin PilA